MKNEQINQAISVSLPDCFCAMSTDELQQVFRSSEPNRWGAWDRENHRMITVLWKNYPPLLVKLAGLKAVCRKNEQLSSKEYAGTGYRCEGFFSLPAGGRQAEGYRYSYNVGNIRQSAETILLKKGGTVYSVTCTGRSENVAADHEVFTGIFSGIRL